MNGFEPKQFGKYFLVEKVAVGGMAEIYKAKTFGVDGFEKLLAIKRILPHCAADKDFISMLTDEAKLAVLLSHANIVQVFDLGKIGEDYFIAMEYIHGVNLRDIMYRCREINTPIPPDIAVYIISEVCKGLDYAHRKTDSQGEPLNIVHRDISPQNILLSYDGEVKIVDFGIAKAAMNISHTMAGILKGKIAYMSPEQATGKTINHCTDIFSAGILLYEMFSNKKLFTGESQFEVLKKIRTSKITREKLPDSIPELLKPIIAKALSYKIDTRYQNASDLQVDLTKYLYSTYIDFSPRKLAQFIKKIFLEELKNEQMKRARTASLESQTASMNIMEGARQIDIVHRSDSSITSIDQKANEEENTPVDTIIISEDKSQSIIKPIRKKRKKWPIFATLLLLTLGTVGFGAFKYIPFLQFWKTTPIETPIKPTIPVITNIQINSSPEQAKIFLNKKDTGLTTPATISELEIGKRYNIRIEKENYQSIEKEVSILSQNIDPINFELKRLNQGLVNIISDPIGATIIVNGKAIGSITPSIIDDLELNKDYKIILSKPNYEDFEQTIKLSSSKPQKISTVLTPIKPKTGSFTITSIPNGAKIIIDEKDTGKITPSKITDLELNKQYSIKLKRNNYNDWEDKILLDKTETQEISGKLTKIKPIVEKPHKPITKPNKPITKPIVEKPLIEAINKKPGKVKITSKPSGAQVFINSDFKGETPLEIEAPSGNVKILVSKKGYAHISRNIKIEPGKTINLSEIRLPDLYGEVELVSTPSRAIVIFDGQQIPAKTPVTIRKVRRDQDHTISISLSGYKTWTKTFSMDGGDKHFNVILEED